MSEEERNLTSPETPPEGEGTPYGGESAAPQATPAELPPVEGPAVPPSAAGETEAQQALAAPGSPLSPAPAISDVSSDDRLMAALAWVSMVILQLPAVSLVLLLAEGNKNRLFQRYHAVTSIMFWVAAFIYEILAVIAFTILAAVSLGCLAICLWVIFLVPHAIALYYALQAYSGKATEIPFISEFARKQGWV